MTVHTGLRGRDAGKRKFFDGCVAVAAIDAVVAYVMFVTELNWLLAREVSLGVIGGSVEFKQHPNEDGREKDCTKDRRLRDEVGASIENLPHRFLRAIENWKQGAANASK